MIREATRSDLIAFYGRLPPMTVRALVSVSSDNEPRGVAGYYLKGAVAVAFSNQKTTPVREAVEGAKAVVDMLRRLGVEVFAGADGDGRVLRHFGFAPYADDVWRLTK